MQIIEAHLISDHVHMCNVIPPKYPVASGISFFQRKSAIAVSRQLCGKEGNFSGEHLWVDGYGVSTVGFALEKVRPNILDPLEAEGSRGRFWNLAMEVRFGTMFRYMDRLPLRQPHSSGHQRCRGFWLSNFPLFYFIFPQFADNV